MYVYIVARKIFQWLLWRWILSYLAHNCSKLMMKCQNNISDTVLVFLLNLNIIFILFNCFYCWLWTGTYSCPLDLRSYSFRQSIYIQKYGISLPYGLGNFFRLQFWFIIYPGKDCKGMNQLQKILRQLFKKISETLHSNFVFWIKVNLYYNVVIYEYIYFLLVLSCSFYLTLLQSRFSFRCRLFVLAHDKSEEWKDGCSGLLCIR